MPIYEYVCDDCQTHFEKIVFNKTQEIVCPSCASKKNSIQLSVFSSTNGSANGASVQDPPRSPVAAEAVAAAVAAATSCGVGGLKTRHYRRFEHAVSQLTI